MAVGISTGYGCGYGDLQKRYACVRDGSVVISEDYLKECEKNPEKAKELEENLSFYKKGRETGYRSALANANILGTRVVNYSENWSIDPAGKVTMVVNTTVVSGKKAQRGATGESLLAGEKLGKTGIGATDRNRKTAADEVAYLAKKYKYCAFAAVNFRPGMRYGTLDTTNIAISPDFLKKMANAPEVEREYESYFEDIQRLDVENISSHAARGRRIVAQGWAIDRNGQISRWGVSEPTNQRRHGQEMI